ncbi:hypothetical protein SEA_MAGEL_36 [Gordonia phage Magel]|uniref:Uncharacterized protein n=1 Tax=Gordonia phage Magel TaxID=2743986 RepID=A0A7D5JU09_9CAUD|nr:hypothetical protein SEA_MAGEL_36 [Gordonia phage Magel]
MNPKNIQIVVGASMMIAGTGLLIRDTVKRRKAEIQMIDFAKERNRDAFREYSLNTKAISEAYATVAQRAKNQDETVLTDIRTAFENELAFQKISVRIEM